MARRVDTSAYKSFDQITDRLDAIIGLVRDKDTSLERSLDLFDEAIALGSKAVDMVDTTNFTPTEEARLREQRQQAVDEGGQDETAGKQDEPSPKRDDAAGDQAEEAGEPAKEE